jgi:plasmid stability protein
MPDILVRGVPERVVRALKQRAALHRRSLQREVVEILTTAASSGTPAQIAARIRARLLATGRTFTDSAPLIREDRER